MEGEPHRSNIVQAQKEVICTKLHTVLNKPLCVLSYILVQQHLLTEDYNPCFLMPQALTSPSLVL